MPPPIHKLIITGTGRAGTTFLVQLLTELQLDTGYTPSTWRRDYFEHCAAGLERDLDDPTSPYILKNPQLCETLAQSLAGGGIVIDHALIPVRSLEEAARSRLRIGGSGRTPGGLVGTAQPDQQQGVLAERFHRLVHTLVLHEIPHTFLLFPRFATDSAYAWSKLRFLRPDLSLEAFSEIFARVSRPDLIHDFRAAAPAGAGGQPARAFAQQEKSRRRRRRLRRACATGALLGAAAWAIAAGWGIRSSPNDSPPASVPVAAMASSRHIIKQAASSFNRPVDRRFSSDSLLLADNRTWHYPLGPRLSSPPAAWTRRPMYPAGDFKRPKILNPDFENGLEK